MDPGARCTRAASERGVRDQTNHVPHPMKNANIPHDRIQFVHPSPPCSAKSSSTAQSKTVAEQPDATSPRKCKPDTRALLQPRQRQRDERAPRPPDEPSALGEEREVCVDERADLGHAIAQQERRGERTRIAEPHAARIRREEPQPRKPDLRPVQDRTVERKARPQRPEGESNHGKPRHRPRPSTPAGRTRRTSRTTAHEPPPDRRLQTRHENPRPRLRQEEHREQRRRKRVPEPGMPPPAPAQRQKRAQRRRRVVRV